MITMRMYSSKKKEIHSSSPSITFIYSGSRVSPVSTIFSDLAARVLEKKKLGNKIKKKLVIV